MVNDSFNRVVEKYNITKTKNIIYGTNIPMPNMIIPTPFKTYIRFDKTKYYFFLFDEKGITLYDRDSSCYATILWEDVEDFKISHFLIIGKMTIKTKSGVYKFQINRVVLGCNWLKENTKFLESNNYFYNKNESH